MKAKRDDMIKKRIQLVVEGRMQADKDAEARADLKMPGFLSKEEIGKKMQENQGKKWVMGKRMTQEMSVTSSTE